VKLACPQCGAEVVVQEAAGFVRCAFCGSSLTLDLDGARLHYLYRPRQDAAALSALLQRWRQGAGLPPVGERSRPRLVYRPFWRYTPRGTPRLVPAWPTLDPRWEAPRHPEGEQTLFDPDALRGTEVIEATLVEGAARERALAGRASPSTAGTLVHLPFYDFELRLGTAVVQVSVDACSGHVYSGRIPSASSLRRGDDGRSAWLTVLGVLSMAAEAAVIRSGWLAALAVAITAAVLTWALRQTGGTAGQSEG
jgi:hypothetical protein